MYKLSKFNYFCENNNNELLMFNSFIGTRSFCKISNEYKEKINMLDLSEKILNELYDKGIIVDRELDEDQRLYSAYLRLKNPSHLFLTINPTEHCNFRCTYCYESFKNGTMSQKVQNEIIKFVRENIHNYSGLIVGWFGGEPLMAMDCIANLSKNFMEICKFNKKPYTASMTTNGYLLNYETFNELLTYKVRGYQISIDGTKELHNKQRITPNGKPTFDVIVRNLDDIRKSKRGDFAINIRSNVTYEIFDNLDKYVENVSNFCQSDDRFSVSFYKVGNWLDKVKDELRPQLIDDILVLKEIYKKFVESDKPININVDMLNPGGGVCYGGKLNNYLLCADGSLHKCTVDFEDPKSIVGKIENGTLSHNPRFYSMLSSSDNCPKYKNCFYAPICMGDPCPLKKRNVSNCPYHKEHLDEILVLYDKNKPFQTIVEG